MDQPPSPKPLAVVLIGVQDYPLARLAPVQSAKDNLLAWYSAALRMGLEGRGAQVLSDPPLTLGDVARAVVRWDLPAEVQARAFAILEMDAAMASLGVNANTLRRDPAAAPDEAAEPRRAGWRRFVDATLGGEDGQALTLATRLLLDFLAGRDAELLDLPALTMAFLKLQGPGAQAALRTAGVLAPFAAGLRARGWIPPCDAAELVADLRELARVEALMQPQDLFEWSRLTSVLRGSQPELFIRPTDRATVMQAIRDVAGAGRGLLVFSGHGGLAEGEGLVLALSGLRPAAQGLTVDGVTYDREGLLTVADLQEALGEHAERWTLALDTCHAGGPSSALQGSQDLAAWSRPGKLRARVLAGTNASGMAAEAVMGGANTLGAFTWAITEVLSRWAPTDDGAGRAFSIANGNLVLRANMLLSALSFTQRVSMSAPGPVADLPFMGFDPGTRLSMDPNERVGGVEISGGTDEIFSLEVQNASGITTAAVWTVSGGTPQLLWLGAQNAPTQPPNTGDKLVATLAKGSACAARQTYLNGLSQQGADKPPPPVFTTGPETWTNPGGGAFDDPPPTKQSGSMTLAATGLTSGPAYISLYKIGATTSPSWLQGLRLQLCTSQTTIPGLTNGKLTPASLGLVVGGEDPKNGTATQTWTFASVQADDLWGRAVDMFNVLNAP